MSPYFFTGDGFTITDRITYHAMMMANDEMPKMATNGMHVMRKIYFTSFPFHPHCLNFNANIGISETKSQELTKTPTRIRQPAHEKS